MGAEWIISLLLAGGVAYICGSSCNLTDVKNCLDNLNYQTLAFPLYGQDNEGLDGTCRNIAMSYSCVKWYAEACQKTPECEKDCKEIIKDIRVFLSTSEFENFAEGLCAENSPLRQTYLENVDCFESNADQYASCHNDSQKSLAYLNTIRDASAIGARCCFSTWYGQCFTKATRNTCGENATNFISNAARILSSQRTGIICAQRSIPCAGPPMPPEKDVEEKYELHKNSHSQKMMGAVPFMPQQSKSGMAVVSGKSCNVTELKICYEVLQFYEQLPFPLFGENEAMLDGTCGYVGSTYSCITSNVEACQESLECKEDCESSIKDVLKFLSNSRLENFTDDLCTQNSSLRETYLENIDCIVTNLDIYCTCYNDFLQSSKDLNPSLGDYGTEEKCRFFTWYERCFTNLSSSTCGQNASNLISYAVDKLWSQEDNCIELKVPCNETLLSQETDVHGKDENALDRKKTRQDENRIGNGNNNKTGNKTNNEIGNETDNKSVNETDSEIKGKSSNTAKMQLRLTNVVTMSYFFFMMSYLFHK